MAELQGLGAQLSEAERAGVEIIAVSPDSNEHSQQVADGLHLAYRFVSDRDLAVTRRYGLVHVRAGPGGQDVPRPANVVPSGCEPVRMSCMFGVSPRPFTTPPFSVSAVSLVILFLPCSSATSFAMTTPLAFCQ